MNGYCLLWQRWSELYYSIFINGLTSLPSPQGASSNKFANDGSFLQQFMKMQKEKSNNTSG